MTSTPGEEYAEELREILELRDVPAEVVSQIVREVQSHIVESGEDPVAAFGTAGEYADNFAPRSRMARFWVLTVSSVLLAFGGTYVLINGVFALLGGGHDLWALPPWISVALGATGIASFIALILIGARSKRRAQTWRI
ncbi:hypothetical protein [Arthrobacter crystallopoietes]|uniref:hypothetical protein n=1 Tax=Crystallibacter crystallopoietes TaxID=37928 RepID=UPI0011115E49|nr:hypothetical protein [Arthrobacter crystallopoietes]